MRIGNQPPLGEQLIDGKLYWWVYCGNRATTRFYEGGWRAFEIYIVRYEKSDVDGDACKYLFSWGFSFWFPIDRL